MFDPDLSGRLDNDPIEQDDTQPFDPIAEPIRWTISTEPPDPPGTALVVAVALSFLVTILVLVWLLARVLP